MSDDHLARAPREGVEIKLLPRDGELMPTPPGFGPLRAACWQSVYLARLPAARFYVFAKRRDRVH